MSKSRLPKATPVAAASLQLGLGPGAVLGLNLATGGTAGWFMLLDDTVVPANGAVSPKKVWQLAANSSIDLKFTGTALQMLKGATILFSSTGPFSFTSSATAFISGEFEPG